MKKELQKPQENLIYLTGGGYEVVVPKTSEKIKKDLLAGSLEITEVSSVASAALAKDQRDKINRVLIDTEKMRKAIKDPVKRKGEEIDATVEKFTHELELEKKRIDTLIGVYAMQQEKIRREAADRAMREAAERERLQRDSEEAEQRAERLRLGAEQAAAEAESRKERQAAELAAKAAEAEQVRAADLACASGAAAMAAHSASLQVMDSVRTKGTSVVVDYELLDVHALYQGAPHLVELTPKRRDILAFLNRQREMGFSNIGVPGLKVVERVSIR